MLGKNYNSYKDAANECGIKTLSDRRQAHCLKFAQSLTNCKQTENLIPLPGKTHMVGICVIHNPSRCYPVGPIDSEGARSHTTLTY